MCTFTKIGKADVLAAVDFVTDSYSPNPDAIGIFGYSMGGRIALELIADKAYIFLNATLLAPAAKNCRKWVANSL